MSNECRLLKPANSLNRPISDIGGRELVAPKRPVPARLNCAAVLLDDAVARGWGAALHITSLPATPP